VLNDRHCTWPRFRQAVSKAFVRHVVVPLDDVAARRGPIDMR